MFYQILFILLFFVCSNQLFAQTNQPVQTFKQKSIELRKKLEAATHDSVRIKIYNDLAWLFRNAEPDSMLIFANQALTLNSKNAFPHHKVVTLNYMGVAFRNLSNYTEALKYYIEALKLAEDIKNLEQMGYAYLNIGNIYLYQINYHESIDYFLLALKNANTLKDKRMIAYVYLNLGRAYRLLKDYEKSLEYYNENIKIRKELKDKEGIATSLSDIGEVYRVKGSLGQALQFLKEALELTEQLENRGAQTYNLNNIALIYKELKEYDKAIDFAERSLEMAKKIHSKNDIRKATLTLAQSHAAKKNFPLAYEYYNTHNLYKDSIFNEENNQKIAQLKSLYELEQQKSKIDLLEKDKKIQEEHIEYKNLLVNSFGIAIFLLCMIAFVLFLSIRQRKKANLILLDKNNKIEQQNDVLERQKKLLEKKNLDITASIQYAQRIQKSMLPSKKYLNDLLDEYFILYKPKDIVSGDFYWVGDIVNKNILVDETGQERIIYQKQIYIILIDCTGHGVPGAFMTMIANDSLRHIILDKKTGEPDVILATLHHMVVEILRQEENKGQESMDVGLLLLHQEMLFGTKIEKKITKVEFSGAKSNLLYIQNHEVYDIKSAKHPVGGTAYKETLFFPTHIINHQSPTVFYLYSDGYTDQFGGTEGKKFMSKRLKNILLDIHEKPMEEQRQILDSTIEQWKAEGTEEQIDDISTIGIRI